MLRIIIKTIALLSPAERVRGIVVLLMIILMALLEALGVASIMPFLAVLGRPEMVKENEWLFLAYQAFEFDDAEEFLFMLGVISFSVIVLSVVFKILTKYVAHRFTQMRRYTLGSRLLQGYLQQPYSFFLMRHSSELSKTILSEVDQFVHSVLKPFVQLVAYTVVVIAIVVLLVLVNPELAVYVMVSIGFAYLLVYLSLHSIIVRIGKERFSENRKRFSVVNETLGGIKDVKLLGKESTYVAQFRVPAINVARHHAHYLILSETPKYLIEAIGFGGVLLLALFLMGTPDKLGMVLPTLGLYAFAGYRLLPAVQQIYASLTAIRFGEAALDSLHDDIVGLAKTMEPYRVERVDQKFSPKQNISLRSVSFTYPGANSPVLSGINMNIPVKTVVGLAGSTGAGKTTVIDVILGLLKPSDGYLEVDGVRITNQNLAGWQSSIGYVPQDIFLMDATILENIAFGVNRKKIDFEQVKRSAKLARIHDFIVDELSDEYETVVGERGIRLSGGQRQRIGIARALYRDPPVLVLDEATSALDNETELEIMEAVNKLGQMKTIIMIAHRLATLKTSEHIIVLKNGQVDAQGTYETLLSESGYFAKITGSPVLKQESESADK